MLAFSILLLTGIIVYFYKPFASPPAVAANLPIDMEEAKRTYATRVVENYSDIHQSLDDLKSRLQQDGFRISQRYNLALYKDKSLFQCDRIWMVLWDTDTADRITSLNGSYSRQCS